MHPAVLVQRAGVEYILFQLKLNDLFASALHLLSMRGFADPTAIGAHVEFLVCSDSFPGKL